MLGIRRIAEFYELPEADQLVWVEYHHLLASGGFVPREWKATGGGRSHEETLAMIRRGEM